MIDGEVTMLPDLQNSGNSSLGVTVGQSPNGDCTLIFVGEASQFCIAELPAAELIRLGKFLQKMGAEAAAPVPPPAARGRKAGEE